MTEQAIAVRADGKAYWHKRSGPDGLPYRSLVEAEACTHANRLSTGECLKHGCRDGWAPMDCACAECARKDPARPEFNPYSRGDVLTVAPIPGATIVECTRIACHNRGNGRECWHIDTRTEDHPYGLNEFRDRETAERIARDGGRISNTHSLRLC